jgi:cytidylate kinase
VTISRQAGAGGRILAAELADALNRTTPSSAPWCAWDQNLVEKVAAEHQIPNQYVEGVEDADHRWFSDFMASLSMANDPDALTVYRRVALTIRKLAGAGNAIIVGRGGVFITEGMPGGLHLRLVAPLEFRVQQMADLLGVSRESAASQVRDIDRNRTTFYRQHWPKKAMGPESFAMTINTAEFNESQMVAALVPLIVGNNAASERAQRAEPASALEEAPI